MYYILVNFYFIVNLKKRKYGGIRIGNVNVKVVVGEMNKVKVCGC